MEVGTPEVFMGGGAGFHGLGRSLSEAFGGESGGAEGFEQAVTGDGVKTHRGIADGEPAGAAKTLETAGMRGGERRGAIERDAVTLKKRGKMPRAAESLRPP